MPPTTPPVTLFRIDECHDLMADGCLADESRNLIFASLWGADTPVQEFLARLTLGSTENGLDHFRLIADDLSLPVFAGDVERFEKRTTRAYRHTLFGSMVHLWLLDKRCVRPDKANGTALALFRKADPNRTARLWTLVQNTCPLPLLNHWRDPVLELLQSEQMLSPVPVALGPIEGFRLALNIPVLTAQLGDLIRNDILGIAPNASDADQPLARVA